MRAGGYGRALDRQRGALALRLDLVDEGEWHFREALAFAERERFPYITGRNQQGLAEVAARRGETAEAMRHLYHAAELFQQHGAKLYLDQVIAKKLELQGGAGSTDSRATIDVLTESIEAERPDLASRVAPDGTVTILFSDIEGSTALNVELGDDRWMELLGEHNRLVRTAIAEHRGYEVKTEGDAFMVAFQSRHPVRVRSGPGPSPGARRTADRGVHPATSASTGRARARTRRRTGGPLRERAAPAQPVRQRAPPTTPAPPKLCRPQPVTEITLAVEQEHRCGRARRVFARREGLGRGGWHRAVCLALHEQPGEVGVIASSKS
jgi:hypothetical protein